MIDIYTDGACVGNPGPGGWGVLVLKNGEAIELFGGDGATTNNRMEMQAALEALRAVPGAVRIHTDSQYLKNGVTQWMANWKRNGWKTADRKPVKNKDLWLAIDEALKGRTVEWCWVRGHDGDPGNERADALARKGCELAA